MFLPNSSTSSSPNSTVKCCEFYLKNNWCGYGQRCKFSHNLPQNQFVYYQDDLNHIPSSADSYSSVPLQIVQQVVQQQLFITENFEHTEGSTGAIPETLVQTRPIQVTAGEHDIKDDNPPAGSTPSSRPKYSSAQVCRYYERDRWCAFGNQCRFVHETVGTVEPKVSKTDKKPTDGSNTKKQQRTFGPREQKTSRPHNWRERNNDSGTTQQKTNRPFNWRERSTDSGHAQQNRAQKICHYYLKSTCRNGQKCKFAHPKSDDSGAAKEKAIGEALARNVENASSKNADVAVASARCDRTIVQKPEYYLEKMDDNMIKEIRELEISQMKKRIIKENIVEMNENSFIITFNPTDPDWPYDVKEVKFRIFFPADYPKEVFRVEFNCEDNEELPSTLIRHLTESVMKWLNERSLVNSNSGKVELMFRPFLKWFDKNLEELFTNGLKKTKRDIDAKAAGIEFVPYHQLPGFNSVETASESSTTVELMKENVVEQKSDLNLTNYININSSNNEEHVTLNSMDLLQISKKGTELRLCELQLGENIASVVCQNLQLSVKCARCKTTHDIIAAPRRKNLIPCTKCHQNQYVTFRPAMIHQRSCVLGYLDLEDCQAFDLPLVDSTFSVTCLNCDKQRSATGIHYGQTWSTWCYNCNVKLEILVGTFKFQVLRPGTDSGSGPINLIKLERKDKKVKDPAIQEGKPLPNNGTCKHYKKSYRWFRFPCCGKAYPCDLCHNEKELEHEMKLANRIICGFCGKEQPFSSKPCLTCSSNMTQSFKGHWEGGKGCRDKVKMSRDDRQKYTGMNKTTAKSVKDKKPTLKDIAN